MKISIVGGGGTVGSSAAFNIATRGFADEMVLVDAFENLAIAHALDITEAVAVRGCDTVVRAGSYDDISGSDVVVITVSAPRPSPPPSIPPGGNPPRFSRRNELERNIAIISEIAKAIDKNCPGAVVITASNPVEALSYTSYFLSSTRDRKRFIGYSINDATRFRTWISRALEVKMSKVEIITMGEHGDSQVPIFSALKVDGKPVSLSDEVKDELRKKPVEYLPYWASLKPGRSSGWLSGAGLLTLVEAVCNDSKTVLPCSAILDGEYGYSGFSMTVPAILGRQGVSEILELKLDDDEKRRLEESASVLKQAAQSVEEILRERPEA